MNKLIYKVFILLTVFSCSSNDQNELENQLIEKNDTAIKIDKELIDQLIQSFPSPLETSLILKKAGNNFNSEMLISTKKTEKFITNYDQSIAIGAYGADLAYINIYDKSFLAVDYLTTIRSLSIEIEVDRFFNFESMMKLAKSSSNIDSLIHLSTESFNKMEVFLKDKGRDELSVLIVFGTWLESSYIISYLAKNNLTSEMKNQVAEQKESVTKLLNILHSCESEEYFKNLISRLKKLDDIYQKVEIKKIIREPEMREENGSLVFYDKSETIINASEKDILSIIDETINLRNQLLK
ncbi:MAG: hypothetical protein HYR91_01440 [Flavobacteriia bacterium]|nr:hypothetical protein [Flavobacteriia bacterium]